MHRGLQLLYHLKAREIHGVNFGSGEQARLLTVVLGSVAAQERANSIAEDLQQLNKDHKDLTKLKNL